MPKKEKCITPKEVELALKSLEPDVLHKLVAYIQAIIRWKKDPKKYLEPISENGKIAFKAQERTKHGTVSR